LNLKTLRFQFSQGSSRCPGPPRAWSIVAQPAIASVSNAPSSARDEDDPNPRITSSARSRA
jgi:hypothetical protein